jgi:hypothetical protein
MTNGQAFQLLFSAMLCHVDLNDADWLAGWLAGTLVPPAQQMMCKYSQSVEINCFRPVSGERFLLGIRYCCMWVLFGTPSVPKILSNSRFFLLPIYIVQLLLVHVQTFACAVVERQWTSNVVREKAMSSQLLLAHVGKFVSVSAAGIS